MAVTYINNDTATDCSYTTLLDSTTDGADELLMSLFSDSRLESFRALYLGSGDHYFMPAASRAHSTGLLTVCVISDYSNAAKALVRSCQRVIRLGLADMRTPCPGPLTAERKGLSRARAA